MPQFLKSFRGGVNPQNKLRRVPRDYVEYDKYHPGNQEKSGDQKEEPFAEKNEHGI
jgi:hypothetical protein